MICVHCGSEIEEGVEVCPNCGEPQEQAPVAMAMAPMLRHERDDVDKVPIQRVLAGAAIGFVIAYALVMSLCTRLGLITPGAPSPDAGIEEGAGDTESQPEETDEGETQEATPVPPSFSDVKASSSLAPNGVSGDFDPIKATDNDFNSAWSEGAYSDGVGEWIELSASEPQHVTGLSVVNGYSSSRDSYDRNNRLKDVTITLSDGYEQHVTLADTFAEWQDVQFDGPHDTTFIRVTINSVYDGTVYYDTCLSEIKPL